MAFMELHAVPDEPEGPGVVTLAAAVDSTIAALSPPAADAAVVALARAQALDLDRFKACVSSENSRKLVAADLQDGVGAGINGTPGVIVINHKTGKIEVMPGAVPAEVLRSAVDGLLKP